MSNHQLGNNSNADPQHGGGEGISSVHKATMQEEEASKPVHRGKRVVEVLGLGYWPGLWDSPFPSNRFAECRFTI